MTVLYVTHDPHEAFAIEDRILIMRDGQVDQGEEISFLNPTPIDPKTHVRLQFRCDRTFIFNEKPK